MEIYNGSITKEILKDKYIFWDIDGVLAPYRFNGHVGDPTGTKNGMSLEEIEDGCFLHRKPIKKMQRIIENCESKENIIMGHCQVQKEMDDKQIWLDKYYPSIKERLLVFENIPKYQAILSYCELNKISISKVIFVDDTLSILREAEKYGINCWHISSFIDLDY